MKDKALAVMKEVQKEKVKAKIMEEKRKKLEKEAAIKKEK